jgi:hypothetical protein
MESQHLKVRAADFGHRGGASSKMPRSIGKPKLVQPQVIVPPYPLVNIQKAIENGHRNSGFTHEKW